ncbi:hypothetical protein [Gordonibacter sp. An230]|uniref:hypothetical protein n=1 Tax=Gordonibacter sp. An230 TaxID=1965592 RepID=UPI00112017FE|nr:hypothetical protein [Gordonibacter sp. An230]
MLSYDELAKLAKDAGGVHRDATAVCINGDWDANPKGIAYSLMQDNNLVVMFEAPITGRYRINWSVTFPRA